ncbi:MAG: AAA family ATPase [Planctomycetaceae bacterium]|jgi:uncharacterized protein YhaN|nr:AAA family ATPase [Planctomycetaceae bacterium]
MKITSFEIERFGLWSGLTVPKLSGGINVFYGANEAGKSTLMEFVRAELYGFGGERRRYARKPGNVNTTWNAETDHEGKSLYVISGGVLQIESPSGHFQLRRTFHPNQTAGNEEKIDIQTPDGNKQGTQLLRVLVSGVDEPTFNNVFAIGLDELQKLGSLNDTEAAEMLFRLSVGMDRVSIVDAIKELTARRNRILNNNIQNRNNKTGDLLTQLFRQREKVVSEISEVELLVRDYVRIRNEQRTVDRTIANLEEDHLKLQREKRLYEIAKQAEPVWIRRSKIRDEINAMGMVVVVTDQVITQLDEIGKQIDQHRLAYNKLKEEFQKAQDALNAQPINETLEKLAPRLEILLEEEKRIVEIDTQITNLENEIAALESRILDEETQIKRGRRSLPIPSQQNATKSEHNAVNTAVNTAVNATENKIAPEHASFNPAGAVISVPTTSPSIPVTAKGYRPNTGDSIDVMLLDGYRIPAKAVNRARRRLFRIKEQHAEFLGRSKVLNEKIKTELLRREVKELPEAVEKASEILSHLKRRQSIGQRLAEMTMHHKELRRINAFLIQHQALPTWAVVLLGAVGVLGAVPVGLAIFETIGTKIFETNIPPFLTILGLFAVGGSFAFKFVSEKNNGKKLEQNQRQLGMLITQIEHAKQEVAAIEAKLPSSVSSIEIRCQEAQQELSQLEKLVPVDTQRREVNQHLKQIETRLERCKEEYETAIKRWNDWLRLTGLPSDWTPARIRDLIEHCDVVGDLKKELDNRYETMNQRIRDMRFITDRIDRMIVDAGLSFADGVSYVDILNEIQKKLEANAAAQKIRRQLKETLRQFRKLRKKAVANLRKAKQTETELLRQFGVKTPEALRELHRRHQKHRRLLQQEQGIQRELDAAIGNFCSESAIGNLLEPRVTRKLLEQQVAAEEELILQQKSGGESFDYQNETIIEQLEHLEKLPALDELLKDVTKRIETASAKLHDELEQRGQLGEQLKRIADDQTAIKKQRELAVLDEKIRCAVLDWQTYAVCLRMLDEIRATYERERQPRTLAEASEILKRLTDGKYQRIWTPLGEETLMVDDAEGNTFDVVWLSRGTREQLFIALRLALASAFAQHGSILPLILDDVLVNFDSRRAFAAAKMLLEFAKSDRQIFLFTCHEHICRIFQKLDVPVRILPAVDDPGKPSKVLLPRSILKRREEKRRREIERLAAEKARQKIEQEIADREEFIRLDALRKAEVQRLILQMQQQATAEKILEAQQKQNVSET